MGDRDLGGGGRSTLTWPPRPPNDDRTEGLGGGGTPLSPATAAEAAADSTGVVQETLDTAKALGLDPNNVAAQPFTELQRFNLNEPRKEFSLSNAWEALRDGFTGALAMARASAILGRAAAGHISYEEAREQADQILEGTEHVMGRGLLGHLYTGANILGSTVTPMLAGGLLTPVGAGIGFLAAGPPGAYVGGGAAMALGTYLRSRHQLSGDLYGQMRQAPVVAWGGRELLVDHNTAAIYARTGGGLLATLDLLQVVPFARAAGIAAKAVTEPALVPLFGKLAQSAILRAAVQSAKRTAVAGSQELAIEVVQEGLQMAIAQTAYQAIAEEHGSALSMDQSRVLFDYLENARKMFGEIGPSMFFLAALPSIGGATVRIAAQRRSERADTNRQHGVAGDTTAYFEQSDESESVPIENVQRSAVEQVDTERTVAVRILDETTRSAVKLPPIEVAPEGDGNYVLVDETRAPVIEALRDAGYQSLRVVDVEVQAQAQAEIAAAEEADAAAEQEGAEEDAERKKPPDVARVVAPPDSIEGQIARAFPHWNRAQVRMGLTYLDAMAAGAGMSTDQYVQTRFQGQMFADAGTAAEMLKKAPLDDGPKADSQETREEAPEPTAQEETTEDAQEVEEAAPAPDGDHPEGGADAETLAVAGQAEALLAAEQPDVRAERLRTGMAHPGIQALHAALAEQRAARQAETGPDAHLLEETEAELDPSEERPASPESTDQPAPAPTEAAPVVPEQEPAPVAPPAPEPNAAEDLIDQADISEEGRASLRDDLRDVFQEDVPPPTAMPREAEPLALPAPSPETSAEQPAVPTSIEELNERTQQEAARQVFAEPPPYPTPMERHRVQVDPLKLKIDAERFQFKSDADAEGVTQRLRGAQIWDPEMAGNITIWEAEDGTRYVVDGHQRVSLAQRLADETTPGDGKPPVLVDTYLYREIDGWTAEQAMALGARKNLVQGSTSAADAAFVLQRQPELLEGYSTTDPMIRMAEDLMKLSEPALGIVRQGKVEERFAAPVGEMVVDPQQQLAILSEMVKRPPASVENAVQFARQWLAAAQESTAKQETLFGTEEVAESLIHERAAVASAAARIMRERRTLFAKVVENAEALAAEGNQLAAAENLDAREQARIMETIVNELSTTTGPVSDALKVSAMAMKEGMPRTAAGRQFADAVGEMIESGELEIGALVRAELEEPSGSLFQTAAPGDPARTAGDILGAVAFDSDNRALIAVSGAADFDTWVHELTHVARRWLDPDDSDVAAKWSGAEDGVWTPEAEERFADGMIGYVREGNVPHEGIRRIMEKFAAWMRRIFTATSHLLNDDIRNVYEAMLVNRAAPNITAYHENRQAMGDAPRGAFMAPGTNRQFQTFEDPVTGRVRLEIMHDDQVMGSIEYADREDMIRDVSGVPIADRPFTVGSAEYRFVPEGLPEVVNEDVEINGVRRPVAEVAQEIEQRLDNLGPIKRRFWSDLRFPWLIEYLAGGVNNPLFNGLVRDLNSGTQTWLSEQARTRSLLKRAAADAGLSRADSSRIDRVMKREVDVVGWPGDHKWTVGDLLSVLRHSRSPQNLQAIRQQGFRIGSATESVVKVSDSGMSALLAAINTLDPALVKFATLGIDRVYEDMWRRLRPVVLQAEGRTLGKQPHYWAMEIAQQDRQAVGYRDETGMEYWRNRRERLPSVYRGMTQRRDEFDRSPIVLRSFDFELNRSIDYHSRYIGYQVPLETARKLLSDTRIAAAIDRRAGGQADVFRNIQTTLDRVARLGEDDSSLERLRSRTRRRVTTYILGGNPATWVKQAFSIAFYASYVDARYLSAAIGTASIPGARRAMMEQHRAFDSEYAARGQGFEPDLRAALKGSRLATELGKRRVTNLFMSGLRFFDQYAVSVGSTAAVLQAMDQFRSGKLSGEVRRATLLTPEQAATLTPDQRLEHAYRYARWVTQRTQPNFLPEMLSSFQLNHPTLAMFSGYTNMARNLISLTYHRARDAGYKDAEANRAALVAWGMVFVGNIVAAMIVDYLQAAVTGQLPDEDELPSWVARRVITGATAPWYIVRDVTYGIVNGMHMFGGGAWTEGFGTPLTDAGGDVIKAVATIANEAIEGEVSARSLQAIAEVVGLATGVPTGSPIIDAWLIDPLLQ